jgi:molybdopterin converting factor small subunit
MEIEVKLFATLKKYLPKGSNSIKMDLEDDTTVSDIIEKLNIPPDLPKIILINGVHKKREDVLKNGDVLSIFPPLAGGL